MKVHAQNWIVETRHLSVEARAGYIDLAAACSHDESRGRVIDTELIDSFADGRERGLMILEELKKSGLVVTRPDDNGLLRSVVMGDQYPVGYEFPVVKETTRWLDLGLCRWWGTVVVASIRPEGRNDETPLRVPVSPALRAEVIERDGMVCGICGGDIDGQFHIDHKHPVARGGRTELDNLQPAHPACNLSKGARIVGDRA